MDVRRRDAGDPTREKKSVTGGKERSLQSHRGARGRGAIKTGRGSKALNRRDGGQRRPNRHGKTGVSFAALRQHVHYISPLIVRADGPRESHGKGLVAKGIRAADRLDYAVKYGGAFKNHLVGGGVEG